MKKIIFILSFCLTILSTSNQAYAASDMMAMTSDYTLYFQTLNIYELKTNEFYSGQKLEYIYLNPKLVYVLGYETGNIKWKNPDYVIKKGWQSLDIIFTRENGEEIEFTISVDCKKSITEVVRPILY